MKADVRTTASACSVSVVWLSFASFERTFDAGNGFGASDDDPARELVLEESALRDDR